MLLVAVGYLLVPWTEAEVSLYLLLDVVARLVIVLELGEILHWAFKLRSTTAVECYQSLSQLWVFFILALPKSHLIELYLIAGSVPRLAKYLYQAAQIFHSDWADWLRRPRFSNFLFFFPLRILSYICPKTNRVA